MDRYAFGYHSSATGLHSFSLELNVHQLVLSDLALSVSVSNDETVQNVVETVSSKVTTRAVPNSENANGDLKSKLESRSFMVRCRSIIHDPF